MRFYCEEYVVNVFLCYTFFLNVNGRAITFCRYLHSVYIAEEPLGIREIKLHVHDITFFLSVFISLYEQK